MLAFARVFYTDSKLQPGGAKHLWTAQIDIDIPLGKAPKWDGRHGTGDLRWALAATDPHDAGRSRALQGRSPSTAGTLPTGSLWVAGPLVGMVLVFAGLSYLPALTLGPIAEHLLGPSR